MMNNKLLTLPADVDEYDDEEDLLDDAEVDSDEVPDEYKVWFPKEYIVGILGHRGGGKSALLAHYLFNCLAAGCTVFTNLNLYPEKLGITWNKPRPLDQDHLLKFDPALNEAVLGIEEVGLWFERKRGMSTTSIIQEKFLQLVVRKQNLRIFFTNQSPLLPGALAEQTDIVHLAFDVFFCDWAREANIAKGTTFLYQTTDRSGIGGMQGRTWPMTLRKAHRMWGAFDTNQMYDPLLWARKTVVQGGEQVIDLDAGEAYSASEEGMIAWDRDLQAYNVVLNKVLGWYESVGFLGLAAKHKAVEVKSDRYSFSVDKLRKAISTARGQVREDAEKAYEELRALASQGRIARFGGPGHDIIELARPVTTEEKGEEQ
jgi:hypothetical protein